MNAKQNAAILRASFNLVRWSTTKLIDDTRAADARKVTPATATIAQIIAANMMARNAQAVAHV